MALAYTHLRVRTRRGADTERGSHAVVHGRGGLRVPPAVLLLIVALVVADAGGLRRLRCCRVEGHRLTD